MRKHLTKKQEHLLSLGICILIVVFLFAIWQSMLTVKVVWNSGGIIRISCLPQGIVVTHLIAGEGETWRFAPLPEPFLVVDSISGPIPPEVWQKLKWQQVHGEPMPPPEVGAPMRAVYYRPQISK